ncbi:MAG: hypothetical protein AAF268_02430 [Cyanobacteria bacterium P01_A01_bin.3]
MVQAQQSPRRIAIKPLVVGIMFLAIGGKGSWDAMQESRQWHQLARSRDAQTTGTVINASQLINTSSGRVVQYDITYQFTAPADADTPGGSTVSPAEVNDLLQEQFMQGGTASEGSYQAAFEAAEAASDLPNGEFYFRGQLELAPDVYNSQLSGRSTVAIAYDADNPSNSNLEAAVPPSALPNPPSILLLVMGALLTALGLRSVIQPR